MAELGAAGPAAHEAVGQFAAGLDLSRVIAVGEQARPILDGVTLEGSWRGYASWVADSAAAIAVLRDEVRRGDVVLVKASRSASLEQVALTIADDSVAASEPGTGTDGTGGHAT